MSTIIDKLEKAQIKNVPAFEPGDRVRVHFQVIEGTRRRTQVFEGVVLKRQGSGVRETFTVRKQSFGVGVERTFPVHSTKIEKIEVAARGEVRRAKLYYLRGRVGKRARVRERAWTPQDQERLVAQSAADAEGLQSEAEPVEAPVEAPETTDEVVEAATDEATTEAPAEEAAEAASEESVAEEPAAEEPAAEETTSEPEAAEAPAAEESTEEAPAGEAAGEEAPAEAAEKAPAEEPAAEEAPAEEPAADEPADDAEPSGD